MKVDPLRLIDVIILDPRASDYFLSIVRSYCMRVGFSALPQKSDLYDDRNIAKSNVEIEVEF